MSSCILTDQLLNDRYKIIRPLGMGGMGQTYLAEDTRRPGNPQCVVKQLKPASTDPKFLVTAKRLFDNEAVILEKLGRANDQIPQLLERFEKDGEFYLVQDFVDGEPLSSEMPLGQRWSETQVIQLLQEVLPILDAVHNAGIIHRDVKPDNLIRRKDGKLCLIDFGAVKQIRTYQPTHSQLISLTVAIGTPGYMPTEQSKGKPRPNSDLYALGIVAVQALTGMLPSQLREDDAGEVIWRDQAEVSEGLAKFLDKMVRYHFKERFETATEALQVLHQVTDSQTSQAELSSKQSVNHRYQKTVEVEQIRNTPNQASAPSVQSEDSENLLNAEVPSSQEVAQQPISHSQPRKDGSTVINTSAKRSHLLLGIGAMVASCLLTGGSWLLWQYNQQQSAIAQIKALAGARNYDECLKKANSSLSSNAEIHVLTASCQLEKAKDLAGKNDFKGAMVLLSQIPSDTPAYGQVTSLAQQWTDEVLDQASKLYQQGKLDEAIAITKSIPQSLLNNQQKVQDTTKKWKNEWEANDKLIKNAQALLKSERWQDAINEVKKITLLGKPVDQKSDYWNKDAANVIKLAEVGVKNAQDSDSNLQQKIEIEKSKTQPEVTFSQGLSRQESLDLINKWLKAKSEIFASPFNRQLATSLTTGKMLEDITKSGGSIDWLQQNNAYYRYGESQAEATGFFSLAANQVEIEVQIREKIDFYMNGKLNKSEIETGTYRFTLAQESGQWKLSDRKEIK